MVDIQLCTAFHFVWTFTKDGLEVGVMVSAEPITTNYAIIITELLAIVKMQRLYVGEFVRKVMGEYKAV